MRISIDNPDIQPADLRLLLFDLSGKLIWQRQMKQQNETIDLSPYPPNIYLLRLRYRDRETATCKLLKQ